VHHLRTKPLTGIFPVSAVPTAFSRLDFSPIMRMFSSPTSMRDMTARRYALRAWISPVSSLSRIRVENAARRVGVISVRLAAVSVILSIAVSACSTTGPRAISKLGNISRSVRSYPRAFSPQYRHGLLPPKRLPRSGSRSLSALQVTQFRCPTFGTTKIKKRAHSQLP
jgi:hypothetical protein